jgi:hypothetical protein
MKDIITFFKHLQHHKVTLRLALTLLETHPPCDSIDSPVVLKERTKQNDGSEQSVVNQDKSKSSTWDTIPAASELGDINSEGTEAIAGFSTKDESQGSKARNSNQKSNSSKEKKGDGVAEGRKKGGSSGIENSKTKNGNALENSGGDGKKTDGDVTDDVNFDSSSEISSEEEYLGSEAGENEDTDDDDDDDEEFTVKETKVAEKSKKNTAVPVTEMGEADIDPTEVECILTDSSDDEGDCDNFNDDDLVGVEADSDEPSSVFSSIKIKEESDSKQIRSSREQRDGNLENVDMLERSMQELFRDDTSEDMELDRNKTTVSVKQEPQEESGSQSNGNKPKRRGIECEICRGKFSVKEGPRQLLDHLNSLHGFTISAYCAPKEFVCSMRGCREVFSTQGSLSYHLSEVHQQEQKIIDAESFKVFQCPYCVNHSTSKVAMRQHVFAYHRENYLSQNPIEDLAHRCRYCARLFWRTEDRDDHQVDVHKDKMDSFFKCYVCSHLFSSKVCFTYAFKLQSMLYKVMK